MTPHVLAAGDKTDACDRHLIRANHDIDDRQFYYVGKVNQIAC
jgi:hypothetical protein